MIWMQILLYLGIFKETLMLLGKPYLVVKNEVSVTIHTLTLTCKQSMFLYDTRVSK